MQRKHYADLGNKINMRIDYNEYDEEQTGIFTTHSDYLRIIQLAKLRGITPEQQYNLREHSQDLSVRDLKILDNELKEYKKCLDDPVYFAKEYCKIIHLDKGLVPFNLYPYQAEMNPNER